MRSLRRALVLLGAVGLVAGAVPLALALAQDDGHQRVAKYAWATRASVNVTRADGRVLVQVSDDGVGGADPATGSGLRGLVDRVSALGGTLEVDSPPGRGTTVRAAIPCD
jgi:glucose-6-phosphate-specific signal transduction histidine kinase